MTASDEAKASKLSHLEEPNGHGEMTVIYAANERNIVETVRGSPVAVARRLRVRMGSPGVRHDLICERNGRGLTRCKCRDNTSARVQCITPQERKRALQRFTGAMTDAHRASAQKQRARWIETRGQSRLPEEDTSPQSCKVGSGTPPRSNR